MICNDIHPSGIRSFPWALLRSRFIVGSMANIARAAGAQFPAAIEHSPAQRQIQAYDPQAVNGVFEEPWPGRVCGAATAARGR